MIERHDEIGSTQARALELAAAGAPEGTVVVAQRQTAGRGRHGHAWASPEGGLWASIVVTAAPRGPLAISIVAALAARAAIARTAGLVAALKWPNDLYAGRRKLAGVIATERGERIVIGIGIDANVRRADLPPDVAAIATSILDETGRAVDLDAMFGAVLDELRARLDLWRSGDARLRQEAEAALIRHPVRERGSDGRIVGLDPSGALVVTFEDRRATIASGDVEVLWPASA